MLTLQSDHKIFQTLPGDGWRVLIAVRIADGGDRTAPPEVHEHPVAAWVTHKASVKTRELGRLMTREVLRIDPMIRGGLFSGRSGFTLFNQHGLTVGANFLAPGEARTAERDAEAIADLELRERDGVNRD